MKKSKLLLCSLMLSLAAFSAGATTILPVDLGKLVDDAEIVFVGTVIGSESVPTADNTYAFTYVTFDIDQTLKGAARSGKTITLRFAGGVAGTNVFEVSGAPTFQVGGKHLLFVEGNDKLGVPLVGWYQGKLDLVSNPVTQQPMFVDHAGRAIDGVKDNRWRRDGLRLNKDGSLKTLPAAAQAAVVSQEGVRIELEKPAQAVEQAAPIGSVLAELRALIGKRKGSSASFRNTQFVESASKSNVPATFGYTNARAK
ncbi:MAG TPA: hypothetical protein VE974_04500 [Thermoanaerobaculia bacterium]|nr:hypothetical protein [Thermoanaerobaculia bacterium]